MIIAHNRVDKIKKANGWVDEGRPCSRSIDCADLHEEIQRELDAAKRLAILDTPRPGRSQQSDGSNSHGSTSHDQAERVEISNHNRRVRGSSINADVEGLIRRNTYIEDEADVSVDGNEGSLDGNYDDEEEGP